MDKFVENCKRTESTDMEPIRRRMNEGSSVEVMMDTFRQICILSEELDKIKKQLFYGKKSDLRSSGSNTVDMDKVSSDEMIRTIHGLVGIQTEVGEIIECLMKHWENGDDLDVVNLSEELGDIMWYVAIFSDSMKNQCGRDLKKICETNTLKLKSRYPDKYTDDLAINRDVKTEREILEK